MRSFRAEIITLFLAFAFMPAALDAHPLGNFTSNHLSRIEIGTQALKVHYVLDDAEIPTFSLLRSLDDHGRPSHAVLAAWGKQHASEIMPQLQLTIDGKAASLVPVGSNVLLRPGAGGLSILYFTADYSAPRPSGAHRITYADQTLPDRIGWKDVVVLPHREPTDELRNYPNALIGSPRDRTSVDATVAANGAVTVTDEGGNFFSSTSAERMNDLSDILGRNLSDPVVLFTALLLAIFLGALHALEPGHGKTLLAVSLVGARATVSQATILAGALTIAHTFGVLAFGAIILVAARYVVPETIYPWIALASGIFVVFLGGRALATAFERHMSHSHAHMHAASHRHSHTHERPEDLAKKYGYGNAQVRFHGFEDAHTDHEHSALEDEAHALAHAIPGTAPLRFRDTLIAAASGNVAPCPAALVVLLAAIATNRIGWGMLLIVAFSIGLAMTLTGLGIAVVRGAGWLTRRPQFDRLARYAPLVTAAAISVIGSVMIGEAAVAQNLVSSPAPIAGTALLIVGAFAAARAVRHVAPGRVTA